MDPFAREGILPFLWLELLLAFSISNFLLAASLTVDLFMSIEAKFNTATHRYIRLLRIQTAVMPFLQMASFGFFSVDYRLGETVYSVMALVQVYLLILLSIGTRRSLQSPLPQHEPHSFRLLVCVAAVSCSVLVADPVAPAEAGHDRGSRVVGAQAAAHPADGPGPGINHHPHGEWGYAPCLRLQLLESAGPDCWLLCVVCR